MQVNNIIIPVITTNKIVKLTIFGETGDGNVFEVADAAENGEALYQIREGCFYEYEIENGFYLQPDEIVSQSKVNKSSGRISPNIYVGTLSIDVFDLLTKVKCGEVKLEVQSVKTTYREDYRHMLEEITEHCMDLLLQQNSPVSQLFETDFNADSKTIYQRFAFIKSMLDTEEFNDSVHKIISAPVTKWKESETIKDIRSVRRMTNASLRQICGATNRIDLPEQHPLRNTFKSVPSKLKVSHNTETVDTPENRFIKHALLSFQTFCSHLISKLIDDSRIKLEAILVEDKLEQWLSHSVFKEISMPVTLPLNSPVLQRKEGYREVLRVWLMFDLAAKLVWHGGDDVYSGGKRDVAVLYEYWLFFKLLEIVKDVFKIEPKNISELIKETSDGLGLQLKQGVHLPLKGIYSGKTRKLEIEFSYNKTFSGSSVYPEGGSWTQSMRPDYTLSIWPYGIDSKTAEKEELIVHVHFDAKYKVEKLSEILGDDSIFQNEKAEQRRGTFKRADLLKMHTYKDAIRRTAGAYILYPGTEDKYTMAGFHELIPGLGAFSVRPLRLNSGTDELKSFLKEVVTHFMNRASQREKTSLNFYETYKDDSINQLNEALPETFGLNRSLLPDTTFVLVDYYKNKQHMDWIISKGLYNARAENERGSLKLGPGEAGAKYLLLHSEGELKSGVLLRITDTGPRVFSKQTLINKEYPTHPSQNYYLVYKVGSLHDKEFLNKQWDISKLEGYKRGRASALPFSITLTDLMKVIIKED
jgi:predicted component of viral defense system (DUF524 family)